tara:strand:- start:10 stop:246 length:237 start_codon:yes stop_codon:yes gene_type:complete
MRPYWRIKKDGKWLFVKVTEEPPDCECRICRGGMTKKSGKSSRNDDSNSSAEEGMELIIQQLQQRVERLESQLVEDPS